MRMQIVDMTRAHATVIAGWCYAPPYATYDMVGTHPEFLLDPANGYHALVVGEELVGYRLFGIDGQVPGGTYDDSALDTGGGLRPDLTGQGLGRTAIDTGLAFGRLLHSPAAFRVTVATFNQRAQRVVESLGFVNVGSFVATTNGGSYELLVRDESSEKPSPA